MANKAKDLASGTLSSSTSASSTSISVSCGSGSDLALLKVWPTTPFYITVMPANPSASVPNSLDSEVMKVSALNANDGIVNMAVSRGQRGTTAKAFSAGDIVSHAVYAEDAVLLGEEASPENPSPWVGTDEIEDGAITTAKIADSAVTNAKIADNTIQNGKIDWNGFFEEVSGTYSTAWKFPDGKMIVFGAKYNGYDLNGTYENAYFNSTGDNLKNVFAVAFYSTPMVVVTLEQNSALLGFNLTGVSTTGFSGYIWKTQAKTGVGVTVRFVAIGRWKA